MSRWIAVLVCLLVFPAPASRADWPDDIAYTEWLSAHYANWDGTVSGADIRIANLPLSEVGEEQDLPLRLAMPWFAPLCVNRERFPWPRPRPARLPHRPLIIRKPPDKASPVLLNADRTKRLLRRVVIRSWDGSGKSRTFVLKAVRVDCFTTFNPGIVPGTDYEEFIALDYGAMEVF